MSQTRNMEVLLTPPVETYRKAHLFIKEVSTRRTNNVIWHLFFLGNDVLCYAKALSK